MNRAFAAVLLMVIGAMIVNLTVLNIVSYNREKKMESLAVCDKYCVMNLIEEKLASNSDPQMAVVLEEAKKGIESPACDAVCAEKIVRAVVPEVLNKMKLSLTVSVTPTPTEAVGRGGVQSSPTAGAEKQFFVPLANASVLGTAWTQAGGTSISMDVSLYGQTLVSSRWEGWLELVGGSGVGYARLYDLTNHRVVDGSEVSVSGSSKVSFYSGNLSLWRGQNQYVVEMRSDSGSEMRVSDSRIKLVVR